MGYFSKYLTDKSSDRPQPPQTVLEEVKKINEAAKTPENAAIGLQKVEGFLNRYDLTPELVMPCAMMLEKQRDSDGMLQTWSELQVAFPNETLPMRMLCRWYRREGQFDEGLQQLQQIVSKHVSSEAEAEFAALGYIELEAYSNLDSLMSDVLERFPKAKTLRVRYIQSLIKQHRHVKAALIADQLNGMSLGPASQKLVDDIRKENLDLSKLPLENTAESLAALINMAPARPLPPTGKSVGKAVFLTGQLGAGGAERQMTRIVAAFHKAHSESSDFGGIELVKPPVVCVRHTNKATKADFFLPVLREAGVPTHVLAENGTPPVSSLNMLDDHKLAIFNLLNKDLQKATLQLTEYFRRENIQVAYLWQDGGVLMAALAAVLAGVPRILTSFRGLPPNMRTELLRPEMESMYKALFKQTGVTFSANSQSTATAYEQWLDLPEGSIKVILNAVPPVLPEGDTQDEATWADIQSKSPDCTQTVLGIFRFDHNKRPQYWVDLALEYCRNHPKTRFVIVGRGAEQTACQTAINQAKMQNRVFLAGPSQRVGFWLHKSDLLMHLARMEGLPNVIIESQLAGVPALATPAGGTSEVLLDRVTGHLLSEAHDPKPEEILGCLEALLSDPNRLQEMGRTGAENAKQKFLVDQVLNRTLGLFSKT